MPINTLPIINIIKHNGKDAARKNSEKMVTLIANNIKKFYDAKDLTNLKKLLKNKPVNVIVNSLDSLRDVHLILFILVLFSNHLTGEIFKALDLDVQAEIIKISSTNQLRIILLELYPDEIYDLINENKDYFKKIFLSLNSEQRAQVKEISKFDEDEAGSIMNPEFFCLNSEWSVKTSLQNIKNKGDSIEDQHEFYVIDNENKIVGYITLHDLIFSGEDVNDEINKLMKTSVITINANDDIQDCINLFQKYELETLPVINESGEMVGIITDNDVLPAMTDEVTEDIYNMYGITEMKQSYAQSSIFSIVKSRIFWLVILMISATLTSVVINVFQNVGDDITAGLSTLFLVPIIPVITGTSGNAGSQAAASVIRALSLGEVTNKEYGKVMWKEIGVGCLLGLILAVINFVRLAIYFAIPYFRPTLGEGHIIINPNVEPYILCLVASAASSFALWIAIMLAKMIGGVLPLIAVACKQDPTVMAMPLIATTLDVVTTSVLFGIGIGLLLAFHPESTNNANQITESLSFNTNIHELFSSINNNLANIKFQFPILK